MNDKDCPNVSDFVDERLKDINLVEAAINNTRKKSMLFQRLKFYQRRRSRSYMKKKTNTRRRDRHILKTHTWYSKRFKMLKIFNCHLPFTRNMKSSKYIYKSLNRGFLFDQTYKQVKLFKRNDNHFLASQCQEGFIIKKQINNEEIEMGILGEYLIISYIKELIDENIFEGLEFVNDIECSFLLINVPDNFYLKPEGLDLLYLKNEQNGGVVFVSKQKAMNTWMWLIKKSLIPVSISELERILLEEGTMNYPFDCVQSEYFKEYEKTVNKDIIEKHERTPKGKRVEIDTKDLFVFNDEQNLKYFLFELPKGSVIKNGIIKQDGEQVGRVIRGGFSFKRGKCRGLGYSTKCFDLEKAMTVNNLDEKKRTQNYSFKIFLIKTTVIFHVTDIVTH